MAHSPDFGNGPGRPLRCSLVARNIGGRTHRQPPVVTEHGASAALVNRVVQLEDKLTNLRKQLDGLNAEEKAKGVAVRAALERLAAT